MTGFLFIIGISLIIWLIGYGLQQRLAQSKENVEVPGWLVFLTGCRTNRVNPTALAYQLYSIGFTVFFLLLMLILPLGAGRAFLTQFGLIGVLIFTVLCVRLIKNRSNG